MNAIGYARCSTQEQADSGLGIEAQKQRIAAYCHLKGLDLADMLVDEGVSGARALGKRNAGGELMLATRRADAVVMLKLDRAFRSVPDCLATVEKWDRAGVALHVVDLGGNAIDTKSAAGRFMLVVLAGAAEMERNLVRERTKAALAVKRANGERVTRADRCPFGWRKDPYHPQKLIEDQEEQRIIRLIKEHYRNGTTMRGITRALEQGNIRCRGSRVWHHTLVRGILLRAGLLD